MRMGTADISNDGTTDSRFWRAKDFKEEELGREADGHPNMTDGIGDPKSTYSPIPFRLFYPHTPRADDKVNTDQLTVTRA